MESFELRPEVRPIEDLKVLALMPNETIVRNHLIKYGSITQNEARDLYGIGRLSAVVYNLRYNNYPLMVIDTATVEGKNRVGKTTRFARYYFKSFLEDENA